MTDPVEPARILPDDRVLWRGKPDLPWCATCGKLIDELCDWGPQVGRARSDGGAEHAVELLYVTEYRCHGKSEYYATRDCDLIQTTDDEAHPKIPLVAFLALNRGYDGPLPEGF